MKSFPAEGGVFCINNNLDYWMCLLVMLNSILVFQGAV